MSFEELTRTMTRQDWSALCANIWDEVHLLREKLKFSEEMRASMQIEIDDWRAKNGMGVRRL